MVLVVAYDVGDDRRRARLHTALLGFGVPVQESVFECEVNERQERSLARAVARIARRGQDRVHFYRLCADCAGAARTLDGPRPSPPTALVV